MALKDLFESKARKMLNEIVPHEEDPNLIQNDEIEKASYSEYSYKKVQKLREKGKYYGYDVPYLQHPVKKQEKPRAIFVVFGVLYAIAAAIALALSVFLVINFLLPVIGQAVGISGFVKFRVWDIFGLFAGVSAIGVMMVWVVVIAVAALIFGVNLFLISQTIKMFRMSKISMQEMAKGYEVSGMLLRLAVLIVGTLIAGIAILVLTRENIEPAGIGLVVGVMVAICALVGTIFGLLLWQRIKAKKEFEELSEEEQKDFIRHNQVLDRLERKRNKSKSLIASTKVDF